MYHSDKVNQKDTSINSNPKYEILTKPVVPNGLGSVINNYFIEHKNTTGLYYGIEDEKDIERKFNAMVDRVTGSGTIFRNKDTGELLEVKNKSRWNKDFRYDMSVKGRLEKEVKGLRNATLVTLTYDMNLVRQLIPDDCPLDEKAFVILFNDLFVTNFLSKTRYYRKKKGLAWNYIASVCEFHTGKKDRFESGRMQEISVTNKGVLHNHIIFYGKWVAEVGVLWRNWGLCQYQGVDVQVRTGMKAGLYIAKYIGKTLNGFKDDPELSKLAKWFWKFRRRLYNTRHKSKGKLGIPKQAYEVAGLFFRDVHHMFEDDREDVKQKRLERQVYRDWRKQYDEQEHYIPYEDD